MINYEIRFANEKDIEKLIYYYFKIYGENNYYKNPEIINYYFKNKNNLNIIIAIDKNEIVSNYSFFKTEINISNSLYTMRWGVNASTLVSHRSQGLGYSCFNKAKNLDGIFGVFGFSKKVSLFYKENKFNLFNCLADKYVKILSSNYSVFLNYLKKIYPDEALDLTKNSLLFKSNKKNKIKRSILKNKTYNYTLRDKKSLELRYFNFSTDEYKKNEVTQGHNKAFIITKRVKILPTDFYATKIIDVFGNRELIQNLLFEKIKECKVRGDLYLDFCYIGNIYKDIFYDLNFTKLSQKQFKYFPELVSPFIFKDNNYRIGLFSAKYPSLISSLNKDNSYFTRYDSDRDRISKFS